MDAPLVVVLIVTDCVAPYVPATGLNVGATQLIVYAPLVTVLLDMPDL